MIQNISQTELAERADISIPFLSQIESGNKFPPPSILAKLSNSLDVKVSELFAERGSIKSNEFEFMIDAMKAILNGQIKSFEDLCKDYFEM